MIAPLLNYWSDGIRIANRIGGITLRAHPKDLLLGINGHLDISSEWREHQARNEMEAICHGLADLVMEAINRGPVGLLYFTVQRDDGGM